MNFITKQIEKKLGMDLNGDGIIGSGMSRGYGYHGGYHPHGHGGGGLINQLENVTHMDLNGDGRIGNRPVHPPNYCQYGAPSYPPNYNSYGVTPYPPPNHNSYDGAPCPPPHYGPYGGPAYPPNYNQYGGAGYGYPPSSYHSSGGGGLINQLERITHMDLNGDGHIGGGPAYAGHHNHYRHGY